MRRLCAVTAVTAVMALLPLCLSAGADDVGSIRGDFAKLVRLRDGLVAALEKRQAADALQGAARDLILRETARAGEAIPEGEEANLADSMRRWREADRVVHVVGRQFAAEASGAARKKGSDPLRPRGLTPSSEAWRRYDLRFNLGFWGAYGALVGLCIGLWRRVRFGGKLAVLMMVGYVPAYVASFIAVHVFTEGPTAARLYALVRPWGLLLRAIGPPWAARPTLEGAAFGLDRLVLNLFAAMTLVWLVGTLLALPVRLATRESRDTRDAPD